MKRLILALLVTMAAALAIAAPTFDPKSMAGAWSLDGTHEGDPGCTLTFTAEPAIGGWAVKVPKACVRIFPKMADVAAWTIFADGRAIGFIDPVRKTVYRFDEVDDGYATDPKAKGMQLVLSKVHSGPAPSLKDHMSGGWSLTGMGGEPRCGFISMANTSGKAGTLVMKPGCAAKWKTAGWASWTQVGPHLTLFDKAGKPLQVFKQGDLVTFEGEDAKGDLIYFSRD